MTLTIDLAPDLESQLREDALREGLDPIGYARRVLQEELRHRREESIPHLSRAESRLLQDISQGLSAELWQQYHDLVAKRRAETLTPEQHQTLIALSDQIEMDYSQRLESVLELARLRGTTLEAQMKSLGIPPYGHE